MSLGELFRVHEALRVRTYPRLVEEASDAGASDYAMRRTEKTWRLERPSWKPLWDIDHRRRWPRATPRLLP